MNNEFLWIVFALVNFSLVTICYKTFGKTGLFAWIAFGTIIANIQVTKTIELFGFTTTLGNIMYGTLFLVTDALGEKYGRKFALKAISIGFFALICSVIIMQIALQFTPHSSDFAHTSLQTIFEVMPRLALASLLAYAVSQTLDVFIFEKIKSKSPNGRFLLVRNNVSTIISQLIDTLMCVTIAFIGIYEFSILKEIFLTTYLFKVVIAMLDTPFVYLIRKIKPLNLDRLNTKRYNHDM